MACRDRVALDIELFLFHIERTLFLLRLDIILNSEFKDFRKISCRNFHTYQCSNWGIENSDVVESYNTVVLQRCSLRFCSNVQLYLESCCVIMKFYILYKPSMRNSWLTVYRAQTSWWNLGRCLLLIFFTFLLFARNSIGWLRFAVSFIVVCSFKLCKY